MVIMWREREREEEEEEEEEEEKGGVHTFSLLTKMLCCSLT